MKIIYSCSFNLNDYRGHSRATRQKIKVLARHANLQVLSLSSGKFKFLQLFFLEIRSILLLIKIKPDIFISRGFVGYFAQKVANYLKIKTVREVHADSVGEVKNYNKNVLEKLVYLLFAKLSQAIDLKSDMRIFNHPYLLRWFRKKFYYSKNDFFSYNGFDYTSKSLLTKKKARKKFNFIDKKKYLIFTGSASYWHGINYLSNLQKAFNKMNANIQIICGGGKIITNDDPEDVLINITPLNEKNCSDLVMAADACIVSVRKSRVSPGSPLKIYDYFLHKKMVITSRNLKGYSDEVLKYGNGILVDFNKTHQAATKIIKKMKYLNKSKSAIKIYNFSWDNVILKWIKFMKKTINNNYS